MQWFTSTYSNPKLFECEQVNARQFTSKHFNPRLFKCDHVNPRQFASGHTNPKRFECEYIIKPTIPLATPPENPTPRG